MIKMITSGLKIDVSWEEQKSLEHQREETELYLGTGSIVIHLWFESCSLLLSQNMNVLPCQWVLFGVYHSFILIFSNYAKKAGKYLLSYGQSLSSVFQLLLTYQQTHNSNFDWFSNTATRLRFGVGTGISRLTAAPVYLSGEIPQIQDLVLFFPSSYLENFGVMNRVSSEERNCNQGGRQPAMVCRT